MFIPLGNFSTGNTLYRNSGGIYLQGINCCDPPALAQTAMANHPPSSTESSLSHHNNGSTLSSSPSSPLPAPSTFLPRLPKTSYTLTPLQSSDLEPHVEHLKRLLMPFVRGIDGQSLANGQGGDDQGTVKKRKKQRQSVESGHHDDGILPTGRTASSPEVLSTSYRTRSESISSVHAFPSSVPSEVTISSPVITQKKLLLSPIITTTNLASLPEEEDNATATAAHHGQPRRPSNTSTHASRRSHRRSLSSASSASFSSTSSHSTSSSHPGQLGQVIMEDFEREWSENWLNSVVRRGEGWLGDLEEEIEAIEDEGEEKRKKEAEYEARERVLEEASAVIAMLAGCTASGAIVRELVFPLGRGEGVDGHDDDDDEQGGDTPDELVIKIHDGAISDHLSVGVQTWGSSILLGRIIAQDPDRFLRLRSPSPDASHPRVLELGAGTGLLSILCRALLDEQGSEDHQHPQHGSVVATDYHPAVLENLQKCVNLNFEANSDDEEDEQEETSESAIYPTNHHGLQILPLDWSIFPAQAEASHRTSPSLTVPTQSLKEASPSFDGNLWQLSSSLGLDLAGAAAPESLSPSFSNPFDLILVADCVYDLTHAGMIKDCLKWLLRPPAVSSGGKVLDEGGVVHLLSPLRPTYAAETETILNAFPFIDTLPPRSLRQRTIATSSSSTQTPLGSSPVSPSLRPISSSSSTLSHTNLEIDPSTPRTVDDSGTTTPTGSMPSSGSTAFDPLTRSLERLVVDSKELKKRELKGINNVSKEHLAGMGLGEAGGWILATKKRAELERIQGTGRADETEYWWWEIGWA